MKKKFITFVLVTGMLLEIFTGCGNAASTPTGTANDSKNENTVTLTPTAIVNNEATPSPTAADSEPSSDDNVKKEVISLSTEGIDPSIVEEYNNATLDIWTKYTGGVCTTIEEVQESVIYQFSNGGYEASGFFYCDVAVTDLSVLQPLSEYQELVADINSAMINDWGMTREVGALIVTFFCNYDNETARELEAELAKNKILKKYGRGTETYEKATEALASLELEGKSVREKIKAIHDYVALNTVYDYEGYEKDEIQAEFHTAEGPFLYGMAVCDGYAEAFELMAALSGIDCYLQDGNASSDGFDTFEGHAWDVVKLDGEWYHLDVTWDDPDKGDDISYKYFLITDEELESIGTHVWRFNNYFWGDEESENTETGTVTATPTPTEIIILVPTSAITPLPSPTPDPSYDAQNDWSDFVFECDFIDNTAIIVNVNPDMYMELYPDMNDIVKIPAYIIGYPVKEISAGFEIMAEYDFSTLIIPNTVKIIDECAFWYWSNLVEIVIPSSVTSIGVDPLTGGSSDVFEYCTSLAVIHAVKGSYADNWCKTFGYSDKVVYD